MSADNGDTQDVSIPHALVFHSIDGLSDQEHPETADRPLINRLVEIGFRQFKGVERRAAIFHDQLDLILADVEADTDLIAISVLVAVLDDVADDFFQREVDSKSCVRVNPVGLEEGGGAPSQGAYFIESIGDREAETFHVSQRPSRSIADARVEPQRIFIRNLFLASLLSCNGMIDFQLKIS